MATGTTPVFPPSRRDPRQVSNTLKLTLNYNDTNVATADAFANSLPLGAFITDVAVEIVVAFNAGTTNAITVGTNSASYNNMVSSGDVVPTSTGVTKVSRGWGRSIAASAEQAVNATYTQTGTSATTGQAVVVITYEGGWLS